MTVKAVRVTSDFITLQDGPTFPVEALALAWNLENRGFYFLPTEGGMLRVIRIEPVSVDDPLTETDRASITKWKHHLLELCEYISKRDIRPRQPAKRDRRDKARTKSVSV